MQLRLLLCLRHISPPLFIRWYIFKYAQTPEGVRVRCKRLLQGKAWSPGGLWTVDYCEWVSPLSDSSEGRFKFNQRWPGCQISIRIWVCSGLVSTKGDLLGMLQFYDPLPRCVILSRCYTRHPAAVLHASSCRSFTRFVSMYFYCIIHFRCVPLSCDVANTIWVVIVELQAHVVRTDAWIL